VIVQLSGESSARRIRSGRSGGSGPVPTATAARREVPVQISNGTTKVNTLPLSTSLSTQMRPLHQLHQALEIVRPSPEPPNRRVVEESACVNRSNTRPNFSAGMPMPVSETVNRNADERKRHHLA